VLSANSITSMVSPQFLRYSRTLSTEFILDDDLLIFKLSLAVDVWANYR
jgi:hypothetical protein